MVYYLLNGNLSLHIGCSLIRYPANKEENSYIISKEVMFIDYSAFSECKNLETVYIANGVQKICDYAFSGCDNLKNINIPSTLTEISKLSGLSECTKLENIVVEEGNKSYCSEDGVLFNSNKTMLIHYPANKKNTNYIISDTVKSVCNGAFSGCNNLSSIKLSKSMTAIPEFCFSDCTGLEKVEMPKSIEKIYNSAFSRCLNLTNINLGSVTFIGKLAFNGCSSLKWVDISNVNKMDERAFSGCAKFDCITLGTKLTKIEQYTFEGCENLVTVYIPTNIEYIDYTAFDNQNISIGTIKNSIADEYAQNKGFKVFYMKDVREFVIDDIDDQDYTGVAIMPKIVVKYEDEIVPRTNYSIKYENNINAGIAKISIIGERDYLGEINKTFNIIPADITKLSFARAASREYTGKEISADIVLIDSAYYLKEGIDYNVVYLNNINIGTAYYKIEGIGNYKGTLTGEFKIVAKDLSKIAANVDTSNKTYTGKEIITSVSLKDESTTLKEGTDYKVSYKNNTNVGTATVTLEGIGNYTGTITKEFKIVAKPKINIVNLSASIDTSNKTYTGKDIKTSVTLKDGSTTLKESTDYKVSYKNNTNVGTATVIVEGIGNYTGTITKEFKIVAKPKEKVNIVNIPTYVDTSNKAYTGKNITTYILLQDNNVPLKEGTDYKVSYKNNINTGTATVTITGIGNYTGTTTKTFKIIPKKVTISSVKNVSKKSAKVTWKKDTQTTGYEVYISTAKKDSKYMKTKSKLTLRKSTSTKSKKVVNIPKGAKVQILKKNVKRSGGYTWYKVKYNGKTGYVASKYLETIYKEGKYSKVKTITSNKITTYTKTKLSKGKKYTFKIRSYKVVDGIKYYASYSNVKWVTIKK